MKVISAEKKKERYFQTTFLLVSVIFRKIRSHIINRVQILEVLPHCLFIYFWSFCVSPVQHQQPWWTSSTPLTCRETLVLLRAARLTVVHSLPSKPPWQVTQWLTVTGRHTGGKTIYGGTSFFFFWSRSQWFVVGLKVRSFVVVFFLLLFFFTLRGCVVAKLARCSCSLGETPDSCYVTRSVIWPFVVPCSAQRLPGWAGVLSGVTEERRGAADGRTKKSVWDRVRQSYSAGDKCW